jgi:hypothetical protein
MDKTSWEHPGPCLGPLGPWQPSTRRERTSGATQPHLGMLSVHHPHPMDPSRFWSVSQNLQVVLVTCCYMLSILLSPDASRCMYSETYIIWATNQLVQYTEDQKPVSCHVITHYDFIPTNCVFELQSTCFRVPWMGGWATEKSERKLGSSAHS